MGCSLSGLSSFYEAVSSRHEGIQMNGRKFQTVQILGEGGYAFVYLVRENYFGKGSQKDSLKEEIDFSQDGFYAIKKVLVQTEEQLNLVKTEISNCIRFKHPHLLPLLDHSITETKEYNGNCTYEAFLLFPVYRDGTLADCLLSFSHHSLRNTSKREERKGRKEREEGEGLSPASVLEIFYQICSGLQHMHASQPSYSHNDLKPGNILLSHQSDQSYKAVIMDFGSATPAQRHIRSRRDALSLTEWASQHCSAPYRAPELWDCPSHMDMDERTDIWSLGCTLFAIMYGQSPFEYSFNESGGSLQLAIMSCQIKFPVNAPYPSSFHELVTWMVQLNLELRPTINDVITHVEKLKAKLPPQTITFG